MLEGKPQRRIRLYLQQMRGHHLDAHVVHEKSRGRNQGLILRLEKRRAHQINRLVEAVSQRDLLWVRPEVGCDDPLRRFPLGMLRAYFSRLRKQSLHYPRGRPKRVLAEVE